MYKENDIFYEDKEYSQRANWCNESGKYHIEEIEPDENGRRFKIVKNPEPTAEEIAQEELYEILNNLSATDYIANKLIEAETEQEREQIRQEYAETLAQRRIWRNRASELKGMLKQE